MGKGIKRAAKQQDKDFAKKKFKVGRKLAKAQNETTVDVRVRQLSLPNQAAYDAKEDSLKFEKQLSLKECLGQASHYSEKSRRAGMQGLATLFKARPEELMGNLAHVLAALAPHVTDADKQVRAALQVLWRECILPHVPATHVGPFLPLLMAHLTSAMTHLQLDIRLDALVFLDDLNRHCPHTIAAGHGVTILQQFADMLSQEQRSRTLKTRSIATLGATVSKLRGVLAAVATFRQAGDPGTAPRDQHPGPQPSHPEAPTNGAVANATQSLAGTRRGGPTLVEQAAVSAALAPTGGACLLPGVLAYCANSGDAGKFNATAARSVAGPGRSLEDAAAALSSSLLQCWDECAPAQLSTSPEADCLACLVACLECLLLLLDILHLPAPPQGATTRQREVSDAIAAFLTKRASRIFPVCVPALVPSAIASQQLVQLNTLLLRLFITFAPALAAAPLAAAAGRQRRTTPLQPLQPAAPACDMAAIAVHGSNAYAHFLQSASLQQGHAGAGAMHDNGGHVRAGGNSGPVASASPATNGPDRPPPPWLAALLAYLGSVLVDGVAVPAQAGVRSAGEGVAAPAAVFSVALRGVEAALSLVDGAVRAELLAMLTNLIESKLPTSRRIEVILFQHRLQLLAPRHHRVPAAVLRCWLVGLPQALWELGAKHAHVARAALEVLHAASRCDGDGREVRSGLQDMEPQLVASLGVVVAERKGAPARFVLGPLTRAPPDVQVMLLDLLAAMERLSDRTVQVLALLVRCASVPADAAARAVALLEMCAPLCTPEASLSALAACLLDVDQPATTGRHAPLSDDQRCMPLDTCAPDSLGAHDMVWRRHARVVDASAAALCHLAVQSPSCLLVAHACTRQLASRHAPAGASLRSAHGALALLDRAQTAGLDVSGWYDVAVSIVMWFLPAWHKLNDAVEEAAEGTEPHVLAEWPPREALPAAVPTPAWALGVVARSEDMTAALLTRQREELALVVKDAPRQSAGAAAGRSGHDACLQTIRATLTALAGLLHLLPRKGVQGHSRALGEVLACVDAAARTMYAGDSLLDACTAATARLNARMAHVGAI